MIGLGHPPLRTAGYPARYDGFTLACRKHTPWEFRSLRGMFSLYPGPDGPLGVMNDLVTGNCASLNPTRHPSMYL